MGTDETPARPEEGQEAGRYLAPDETYNPVEDAAESASPVFTDEVTAPPAEEGTSSAVEAPVMAEVEDDDDEFAATPTLRDRLFGWMGRRGDNSRRLYALTHAINVAPDAAVNYLLRGELYLESKQYDLAAEDFRKALELAENEVRQDGVHLGVLAQSVQDRALTGYEDAIRRGENGYNKRKSKVG